MAGPSAVRQGARREAAVDYDAPLPGSGRRDEVNRINTPWLIDPERIASPPQRYAPELFANPAMRGKPVALAPAPPPKVELLPASKAPRTGVRLAVLTDDLPRDTRCLPARALTVRQYKLYPEVRREDGADKVVYWTAYNTDAKRVDYVVGPDALASFSRSTADYGRAADTTFAQGPPDEVTKQSLKAVEAGVRGGFGPAIRQLGTAWKTALSDPKWIAKTAVDAVIGLGSAMPARRAIVARGAAAEAQAAARGEARAASSAGRAATTGETRGAAQATRFRRGNTDVTVEGIRFHPYVENAGGVARTPAEALALAKKHNVRVPDFVRIVADPKVSKEAFAEYRLGNGRPLNPRQAMSWGDLAPDGTVTVRVSPEVFNSDEAIVAVLAHESHELRTLKALVEEGELSGQQINAHINPHSNTNLHGQAWEIADLNTQLMRAETPAARASVKGRLDAMEAKFCRINGVCP
jgi:hypothetical protein